MKNFISDFQITVILANYVGVSAVTSQLIMSFSMEEEDLGMIAMIFE